MMQPVYIPNEYAWDGNGGTVQVVVCAWDGATLEGMALTASGLLVPVYMTSVQLQDLTIGQRTERNEPCY